MQTQHIYIYKI